MGERLLTDAGEAFFLRIKHRLQQVLELVEEARFTDIHPLLQALRNDVELGRATAADDDLLQDLFVIEKYLSLLTSYSELWGSIWQAEYPASWIHLQDAIDNLRLIKKFSAIDVTYFENQLLELETGYPYKVFASIGAIVDRFDCSICGLDIDDSECVHRRGELYRGRLAYGIAQSVSSLDHISLVLNPDDKRCVIQLQNMPEQFAVLAYIRDQWREHSLRIGWLARLELSKRVMANPDYKERGRNEQCYCGTGKKFKRCCIGKQTVLKDHVELVGQRRNIRDAVV